MRVAVICGIYVPHDAISAAIEQQARLLQSLPEVDDVTIFAQHVARPAPCATITVGTSGELLSHPQFNAADVAIFHWGIHYDVFNALIVLSATGPVPVCVFHNCTPLELSPPDQQDTIRRSLAQLELLPAFDIPTWTYSPFNRRTLLEVGVAEERIEFVPFPITAPRALVADRPHGRVEALVVGRLVWSKGIHVLVEALGVLDPARRRSLHVRVVGNLGLSHSEYVDTTLRRVAELGLAETVEFVGTVADDELWRLYETSHLLISPSLHEGLCVPVVEAYLAGCRALGTTAGNLAHIVSPTDPTVPADDPAALAAALGKLVDEIVSDAPHDTAGAHAVIHTYSEPVARDALHHALLACLATARDR